MSFQWITGERRFQAEVDDMLQDVFAGDIASLAAAVDQGSIAFADHSYAARVACELRARAAEKLLFRPIAGRAGGPVSMAREDDIPW